jgi:hypothetical protein
MKRVLPVALLALTLPAVAFSTTVYTTGDFVSGTTSFGSFATSADSTVTAGLATGTLDAGALQLTPTVGSAPQALFLLLPAPAVGGFADNMPLGVAKVPVDMPEPGSLGLLGVALIGLATVVRWKMRGTNTRVPDGIKALRGEVQETTRASVGLETTARAASEVNDGGVVPRAA